jgi:hypothetical protein
MTSTFTLNVAESLIRHATGETYGDGMTVTGFGVGYAEPGYHGSDAVWALGNWNTQQSWRNREAGLPLTDAEAMPAVLATALERAGVEIEWCDEWIECTDCYRIVRTQPDSYGWRQSYTLVNECEPTCADCLVKMGEDAITEYVNEPHHIITWADAAHLVSLGWTRYNDAEYENGWHPGQTDDPAKIADEIHATLPDHDLVFLLDSSGQFDIAFSAYVRPTPADD